MFQDIIKKPGRVGTSYSEDPFTSGLVLFIAFALHRGTGHGFNILYIINFYPAACSPVAGYLELPLCTARHLKLFDYKSHFRRADLYTRSPDLQYCLLVSTVIT